MNKQRKILTIVMAVALGAWLVDRFILSSPVSAPHPAAASPATALPAQSSGNTRPARTRPDGPTIAQRLEMLRDADEMDLALTRESAPATQPAAETRNEPVAEPAPNLRLTVIMKSGSSSMAIINGQIVRVGQRVGRYRVVSIDDKSATVEAGGAPWKLLLQP